MLRIDGSQGEGGGQILRTALAMSLLTGRPFEIHNIRARRSRPGLAPQHLTAVRSAARVGSASVEGAEVRSQDLVFRPGHVQPGVFDIDIGTAGSATLVLQTVLPPLLLAGGPSRLRITGGTHNVHAPPYDFIASAFVPLLRRMGADVEVGMEAYGFYPVGGGIVTAAIAPCAGLAPLHLHQRGPLVSRRARAVVSKLPTSIAERELEVIRQGLSLRRHELEIVEPERPRGPGNAVTITLEAEGCTEVFTGFGERGKRAEAVAEDALCQARAWLDAGVPVGPHLADQLLIPLALARGGSFRTMEPTPHTTTNIDVLQRFLDVRFKVAREEGGTFMVSVAT